MQKFIIVGDTIGLPIGYASSTRTQFISSAITEAGLEVDILLIKPSESTDEVKNTQIKFTLGEATVWYTSGTTTLSRNWLTRRYHSFVGLLNACKHIYTNKHITQSIIIYSRNIEIIIIVGIVAKICGVTSALELCEWPTTQPAVNFISRLKKKLFCRHSLKFVDGAIYISQFILSKITEFEKKNNKTIATFHLPILCDPVEFISEVNPNVSNKMILYCGNLSYRALLDRTLKIMSKTIQKNILVNITVVGSSDNKEDLLHLKKTIQHYNLLNNVIIKGYVSRQELIELYSSAFAFLLPLEDVELSTARFPTKLAEYLLSGRPVIAPDTGEISFFLKNNVNFISPKENNETAFANCLTHLLSNPDLADKVGSEGKKIAINSFDYRRYTQLLSKWLIDLGAKC